MSWWRYDCLVTTANVFPSENTCVAWCMTRHDSMTADANPQVVVSTAYLQMMDGLHQLSYSRH